MQKRRIGSRRGMRIRRKTLDKVLVEDWLWAAWNR
jgi:hypothetical protein